ncbi:hypothetical protein IUY40_10565 [Flavobacterium sp. ALJ2]|uniref:hypothetical protein n=1 Tax=Flavobacterium sp. ALJ2 TaxID=2786960 RepID=UPI00189E4BBE|nr:hypothetical protein [Flavobacterium sp. ALJ2]MBF7091983.1 hypothetical protein [Flavobacterium sp. ALJ2]
MFGQNKVEAKKRQRSVNNCIKSVDNLSLEVAFELAKHVSLNKKFSTAILDVSGAIKWKLG